MKILLIIISFFFISNSNAETTVKLPKDVSSGSKFEKSLTGKYYKKYGYQIVNKDDGHFVRSGEQSIRFEVRDGDCGQDEDGGWSVKVIESVMSLVELQVQCLRVNIGFPGLYIFQKNIKTFGL